jgi:hypothetical protein
MGDPTINRLIKESSYPATLTILMEGDVEKAKKSVQNIIKAMESRVKNLNSVIGGLPAGDYKKAAEEALQLAVTAIKEQGDALGEAENAEGVAGVSKSIDGASTELNYLIRLNGALLQYLAQVVVDNKLHQSDDKDVPLEVWLDENPDIKKSAEKDLEKAIKDVEKPPKQGGGFFAKMMGSLFGAVEELSDGIQEKTKDMVAGALSMTPMEVAEASKAFLNAGKKDEAAADKIDAETDKVEEEVPVDESGDGEEDGDGEEGGEGGSMADRIQAAIEKAAASAGEAGELVLGKLKDLGIFDKFAEADVSENLIHRNSLSLLMMEKNEISGEEFSQAYQAAAEENDKAFEDISPEELASTLNDALTDVEIEIVGVDKPSGDDEDAAEEADTELEDAAKDAIGSDQSPTAGAIGALEDWETNLAPTSQKQLQAKDRIGQLKDLVKTGIEDGATALEDEVSAAIDIWVGEHEETLVKSRRFSKKNFATLKNVVGQIVSKLVTKESKSLITRKYIREVTFAYLDNKFDVDRTLNESQDLARLRRLAGL